MKNTLFICLLFATTANAQITPGCWGLTDSDRVALRLYSSEKPLKWHDFTAYRFKGSGKRAVWISYAVAGILHGGREAYHAEPAVLQDVFGGADDSWIGPMQWKRQYFDRDPEKGHKPNLFNPIRDYYHFSGAASKTVWIGGAFVIGMSKQPMKYKLLDLLIGTLITSGTASLTYNLLR